MIGYKDGMESKNRTMNPPVKNAVIFRGRFMSELKVDERREIETTKDQDNN